MTIAVKHSFVSPKGDGPDSTLVQPSNWNADHQLTGFGDAAAKNTGTTSGTLAAGDDSRITGAIQSALIGTRGQMIRRGASAPEAFGPGATNTVPMMGASDVDFYTLTAILDAVFGTNPGAMLYRDASVWQALAAGALGYQLRAAGAAAPVWAPPSIFGGMYRKLKILVTSNSQVQITADAVVLDDVNGLTVAHRNIYATLCDLSLTGVSGLDTGSEAANTWYHAWLIRKTSPFLAQAVTASSSTDKISLNNHGLAANSPIVMGGTLPGGLSANTVYYVSSPTTNDFKLAASPGGAAIDLTSNGSGVTISEVPALLLSLSSSAPTLPSGYTYYTRFGCVRNDGSSNLYRTLKVGNHTIYLVGTNPTALPLMTQDNTGSPTTPTWTAVGVSSFVPPTATHIDVVVKGSVSDSKAVMVAPNNNYGTSSSTTNPPPYVNALDGASSQFNQFNALFSMALESTNIYAASNAGTGKFELFAYGWTDDI